MHSLYIYLNIMLNQQKNSKKYIPVICFDAPYNKEIDDNNLFRVFDWDEVLNIIKKESRF